MLIDANKRPDLLQSEVFQLVCHLSEFLQVLAGIRTKPPNVES